MRSSQVAYATGVVLHASMTGEPHPRPSAPMHAAPTELSGPPGLGLSWHGTSGVYASCLGEQRVRSRAVAHLWLSWRCADDAWWHALLTVTARVAEGLCHPDPARRLSVAAAISQLRSSRWAPGRHEGSGRWCAPGFAAIARVASASPCQTRRALCPPPPPATTPPSSPPPSCRPSVHASCGDGDALQDWQAAAVCILALCWWSCTGGLTTISNHRRHL